MQGEKDGKGEGKGRKRGKRGTIGDRAEDERGKWSIWVRRGETGEYRGGEESKR